jgi:hypothetical protein
MDAKVRRRCVSDAYGQAVWSCPANAGDNPRVEGPGGTVAKKPVHRGDHGVSRNAIVQGVPDVLANLW